MRKLFICLVGCLACAFFGGGAAMAQTAPSEASLAVGFHERKPLVEYGATVVQETILGVPVRAWAGLGSRVADSGQLTGSFQGLAQLSKGRSLTIELGAAYIAGETNGRFHDRWDAVLKFSRTAGSGAALTFAPTAAGGFGLLYSRRV